MTVFFNAGVVGFHDENGNFSGKMENLGLDGAQILIVFPWPNAWDLEAPYV